MYLQAQIELAYAPQVDFDTEKQDDILRKKTTSKPEQPTFNYKIVARIFMELLI